MKFIEIVKNRILLSENARLFDTKEYLFKTFIAVFIAAYIGANNDYVSKDMISLLFGMMLTLEPVNMSGIRSGLSQIEATMIGAIITGIVVSILGYGVLATAIAITITLYVCMVIDWRQLKVVAVFTSIYMTQYVQMDTLGNASELETFKLRMAALGTGVLIAFIVNFIFSLIGYRRMANKRIFYISKELYDHMSVIHKALVAKDFQVINNEMGKLPNLFNMIDMITGMLTDVKKDRERFKIVYRQFDADEFIVYSTSLRGITHQIYDLCMGIQVNREEYLSEEFIRDYVERMTYFEVIKDSFVNHKKIPPNSWASSGNAWMDQLSSLLTKIEVKFQKNT